MWSDLDIAFDITIKKPHLIRVLNKGGMLQDQFQVFIDNNQALSRNISFGEGEHFFTLDDCQLKICWNVSWLWGKLTFITLTQNGKILAQYGDSISENIASIPLQEIEQTHSFSIQEESNVQEYTELIATDEFPLDNRFGNDTLTVEHEVSKTVSNQIVVETSNSKGGEITASLLTAIQAKISVSLSEKVGQTFGGSITRRHTLRFSVKPGDYVLYAVVWRRKVRKGRCIVSSGNDFAVVPYLAYFDLSCEIKSQS